MFFQNNTRSKFTIAQNQTLFFHQFNQPEVQWLSGSIGYSNAQTLHSRLRVQEFCLPTIQPFQSNIFKDYFYTALVDFGVLFSINFFSSSAFHRHPKSSQHKTLFPLRLVSFVDVKISKHVWDLIFLHDISYVMFFAYVNFQLSQKRRCYQLHWHTLSQECLCSRLINSQHVFFIGSKITCLRDVILLPRKHCCSFIKHFI